MNITLPISFTSREVQLGSEILYLMQGQIVSTVGRINTLIIDKRTPAISADPEEHFEDHSSDQHGS